MKNKKIKFIVPALVFILLVLSTQTTFAVKRAFFPDAKMLQPIPTNDVHANISGNTNSTTGTTTQGTGTTVGTDSSTPIEENTPVQTAPIENTPDSGQTSYTLWIFLSILVVFGLVFLYRKIKHNQTI
jgi:hypothetical protein